MRCEPLRLIFTAYDVGAAGHIAALAVAAAGYGVSCVLVAEGPAQVYLAARRVKHVDANRWLGARVGLRESCNRIAEACQRIQQWGASAVVCGRSPATARLNVDQTFIEAARLCNVPSMVVQDFWGDVWPENCRPDHYLVIDALAASLTAARTQAPAHVVGSLKHARCQQLDFSSLRRIGRRQIGLREEVDVIGYFGQDLSALAGYDVILRDIGKAVARLSPVGFFYKPHPRETEASCDRTLALISEGGACPVLMRNVSIEVAIAAADVVLHCFSTVALDAAYMMCVSGAPEVAIACIDYPQDVRAYWKPTTGLAEFPLVSQGIALSAGDGQSMGEVLGKGLDPAERRRQAQACKVSFGDISASLENVFRLIHELVNQNDTRQRSHEFY